MTSDPTRLLDDPTAAAALRGDLLHASQAELQGLDLAAGLAGLQQATAGTTVATGTGASLLTTLGLGAVLTGGAVALWLGLGGANPEPPTPQGVGPVALQPSRAGGDRPDPSPPKAAATAVPEEAPEPEPEPEPTSITPEPEPEPITPEPNRGPRTTRAHEDSAPEPPAPSSEVDDVLREARLVAKARSKLARDPAEALALTKRAEREFPGGQLVEERRALAIRALVALGRHDEARHRAESFLATFGRGAHAAAVRRALDAEPLPGEPVPGEP